MNQKKEEIIYKILLLGHNDSGKTSFIFRYLDNSFDPMILIFDFQKLFLFGKFDY